MGSTSYDEARDPTDATWSGASWYGPTSGEYWIVNPREYADPRKHGPGYQQRARRPANADLGAGAGDAADPAEPAAERAGGTAPEAGATTATAESAGWTRDTERDASRDARRWSASARPEWAAASGAAADAAAAAAAGSDWQRTGRRMPGDALPSNGLGSFGSLGAVGRDLLGTPADDPIRRLGLALVAWPPLGLAAAAAIGDITGCTTYSAACSGSDTILPWLAQAAILGLLLLLPPLARVFVGGTIAVLLALVPVTAVLVILGAGGAPQGAFVLGALLAAAWIGGVAFAARGQSRAVA
jgi:hypothetical protein